MSLKNNSSLNKTSSSFFKSSKVGLSQSLSINILEMIEWNLEEYKLESSKSKSLNLSQLKM